MKCDNCGEVNPKACKICRRCRHKLRPSSCSFPSAYSARPPDPSPRWMFIQSDVARAVDDVLNSADGHDRGHFVSLVITELKKMQNEKVRV